MKHDIIWLEIWKILSAIWTTVFDKKVTSRRILKYMLMWWGWMEQWTPFQLWLSLRSMDWICCYPFYRHYQPKYGQVCLTRAVFTYLRKAFDALDHELLLQKLWEYGMGAIELVWFKEYLSDWTQVVGYQSFFSDPCALPPDVPRGSMLGPLLILFFLIINDVQDAVSH